PGYSAIALIVRRARSSRGAEYPTKAQKPGAFAAFESCARIQSGFRAFRGASALDALPARAPGPQSRSGRASWAARSGGARKRLDFSRVALPPPSATKDPSNVWSVRNLRPPG